MFTRVFRLRLFTGRLGLVWLDFNSAFCCSHVTIGAWSLRDAKCAEGGEDGSRVVLITINMPDGFCRNKCQVLGRRLWRRWWWSVTPPASWTGQTGGDGDTVGEMFLTRDQQEEDFGIKLLRLRQGGLNPITTWEWTGREMFLEVYRRSWACSIPETVIMFVLFVFVP